MSTNEIHYNNNLSGNNLTIIYLNLQKISYQLFIIITFSFFLLHIQILYEIYLFNLLHGILYIHTFKLFINHLFVYSKVCLTI